MRDTLRRPPPATRLSRSSLDADQEPQQAGRSSTSLHAYASAQSIRRSASQSGSSDSSSISLSQLRSVPTVSLAQLEEHVHSIPEDAPGPAGPDLISLTDSNDTSEGVPVASTAQPAKEAIVTQRSSASLISERPHSAVYARPGSHVPVSARPPPSSRLSSTSMSALRASRSMDPFATQNNSRLDVSATSPLPRYNSATDLIAVGGVSSTDLANRLANPFRDDRITPMHSRGSSACGTPLLQQRSGEKGTDKSPAVAVAAVPTRSTTPTFINDADPEKTPFYPGTSSSDPPFASLYVDQKEDDDDMHMPAWDDDVRFRPTWAERFSRQNVVNTIGVLLMVIGLCCVFIVLPVVSFTGTSLIPYTYETPLDQMPGYQGPIEEWARVNDKVYPLLQHMRRGLIDPDTPASAMTMTGHKGEELVLVYSDEFNVPNRTFYPGDDPFWFAPDFWYGATGDLEWYDPDAATTYGGSLRLQLDQFPNHGLDYRSGMLNSWNQLCFKGGRFEVSMSLPGPAGKHAYWPGVWTMGNLGRPGYLATTDGLWPYTYDSCDAGITPNQSMTDGTSFLPGQRLNRCTCPGEDHPTPGRGRGAPEIDIAEISATWGGQQLGVATQSFQVAPMDIWYYPNYNFMQNPNTSISQVNTWVGGPFQQAVSTTSMLNNKWYDGIEFQKYAYEYKPGNTQDSYLAWYIGDDEMMSFDARAIGPNGNIGQRLIAEEPLSMILNLGFSHNWVDIDFSILKFPTVMQIDYVRWYQPKGHEMVTCDPPGYPTTQYIKDHPKAYNNPNLTHWADAGYSWPTNSLMHGCEK